MSGDGNKDAKNEAEQINLKVVGQDGGVVHFKIKRHTPLRKLMATYCDRAGLNIQNVRFRFDGQPINESDTPAGLDMEDDDTIDVFQQQVGGGVGGNGNGFCRYSSPICSNNNNNSSSYCISLASSWDGDMTVSRSNSSRLNNNDCSFCRRSHVNASAAAAAAAYENN